MCKTIIMKEEDYYMIATESIIDTSVRFDTLPAAKTAALEQTKRTGLNHLVIKVEVSSTIQEND